MYRQLVVFSVLLGTGSLWADEPERPVVKPVGLELKADPEVVKILDNIKPGESALLPAVRTAGAINDELKKHRHDKNGPGPRNYSIKWVWAADRERALFCGGNAGAPHRLNDVWEYDLASNTWVCLWEPDPDLHKTRGWEEAKRLQLIESMAHVKDGVLMTRRGAPYDPVHTWWALTYDPDMKALLWVLAIRRKGPDQYEKAETIDHRKMMLWAYYPEQNRWEFQPQTKSSPPCNNASILEYIPELNGSLWFTNNNGRGNTTSLFDSKTRTWKELLPQNQIRGNPDCPGTEAVSAYVPDQKLLVVHWGGFRKEGQEAKKNTYHFDVVKNAWSRVVSSDDGPVGHDTFGPMTYDSVARKCFIIDTGSLWSYHPTDKKWTEIKPTGPKPPERHCMGCYNPQHNVLMADDGKGRVWVYRAAANTSSEKKIGK